MKIPFDSLCLSCVVSEAQVLVGTEVFRVRQTGPLTVVFEFVGKSGPALLVSAEPDFARCHLVARRAPGIRPAPAFGQRLHTLLAGAKVAFVRQRGLDRIVEVGFSSTEGDFQLVAELMGKHSNIMLVRKDRAVAAAIKWVGASMSSRPIQPNRPYEPPPLPARRPFKDAKPGDDLGDFEGASPFVQKLVKAGVPLELLQSSEFSPVFVPGSGAYPFSVAALGLQEVARTSLSQSLEQHFSEIVEADHFERAAKSLRGQLQRVLLAREVALHDLAEGLATARDARAIQMRAELILAHQHEIRVGDSDLKTWDYEGNEVTIPLRPDQTALENADRLFQRARRAKSSAEEMATQQAMLQKDAGELQASLAKLDAAVELADVDSVWEAAAAKRWLQKEGSALRKEERPFAGHSVKELLSPGGWRVLVGQNATANDFLTTKASRPSDLWFHVRGAPSAHVVLCTNNQPDKVQTADLEFAAQTAVRYSPSKHSSYVSVDYTQRRYVRKPRGAAPGLATYTHEKTIHVTPY